MGLEDGVKAALGVFLTGVCATTWFLVMYRSPNRDKRLEYRQRFTPTFKPLDSETVARHNRMALLAGVAGGVIVTVIGVVMLIRAIIL